MYSLCVQHTLYDAVAFPLSCQPQMLSHALLNEIDANTLLLFSFVHKRSFSIENGSNSKQKAPTNHHYETF